MTGLFWKGYGKYSLYLLTMRAARPTAGSAHTFAHLIKPDRDPTAPGFILLRGSDPANPLIARQRRDFLPQTLYTNVRVDRFAKIRRNAMRLTRLDPSLRLDHF